MIIYHTGPARCFPLLVEHMVPNFANPYHFRMPLVAGNAEDHRFGILENVIAYRENLSELPRRSVGGNGFPYNLLSNGIDFAAPETLRDIDFLYGVFDGCLIRRIENDFVFTMVTHPVWHIYRVFDYLSRMQRTATPEQQRWESVLYYTSIVQDGLPAFIDRFLQGDRRIEIKGRTFYMIDEMFRASSTVRYDFVGVEEEIVRSLEVLSSKLGIILTPGQRLRSPHSTVPASSNYRYRDLSKLLESELEQYHSHLRTLNKLCER